MQYILPLTHVPIERNRSMNDRSTLPLGKCQCRTCSLLSSIHTSFCVILKLLQRFPETVCTCSDLRYYHTAMEVGSAHCQPARLSDSYMSEVEEVEHSDEFERHNGSMQAS